MNKFKVGDVVWVQVEVVQVRGGHVQVVADERTNKKDSAIKEITAILGWADVSDCKQDPQADLQQAIREVLLSDEFLTAFAAAWMKTPLPIAMPSTKRDQEPIESLRDYPFGEPSEARAIPGSPVGWKLVGFKQIQDGVKVFDEDGDYWTFGGTNDPGDLIGALMPIFEKIEAPMNQRKFREVTEGDIGKRIEVTDDRPTVEGIVWHKRTLLEIVPASHRYTTDTGSVWRYARIEATNDPT